MKFKKAKIVALVLSVTMLIGSVMGGTMAWLISNPEPLVNTFTYGDISITLTETDTQLDNDNNANTNRYKMVPGTEITKDPRVTVVEGNEACWLFVKLTHSVGESAFSDFMTYEVADGWTEFSKDDAKGEYIYYRAVDADTDGQPIGYDILKDNKVTVKSEVTKTDLYELKEFPTLTVYAYAVQQAGFNDAEEAWNAAMAQLNP